MTIQKRLLLEQIELLKNCELGRKVMRGAMPETVEEFREQVPLTTYNDYLPELVEKREDVLPTRPATWVHTIARPGECYIKHVPLSERFLYEFEKVAGGVGLLASCDSQGDFLVKEHLKTLVLAGSPYYGTGVIGYMSQQALGCDLLPSNGDELLFPEKVKAGFREALDRGLDSIGSLSAVLVYVGEMLRQQVTTIDARFLLSHPRASARLIRALIRSKLARRPILPRDLWSLKVILGGGTDSDIFRGRVAQVWGRRPLEIYAGVDGGIYATQTWDYDSMTFIPNLNFFEFIPEREYFKWQLDHSYQPRTVLLDEVKAGENYEIVITNLHGGILTRYRIGDLIRITSMRNEKLGIDIPQMVFHSRADDLIDIFGFGRLPEKIVREAIENSGIPCADWTARKETAGDRAVLHIYLELQDDYIASEEQVMSLISNQLKKLNARYRYNNWAVFGDTTSVLDLKPIQVTLLPQGAFSSYIAQRQAEGAELGVLKPPHINPSDSVLSLLRIPKVKVEVEAAPAEAERVAA